MSYCGWSALVLAAMLHRQTGTTSFAMQAKLCICICTLPFNLCSHGLLDAYVCAWYLMQVEASRHTPRQFFDHIIFCHQNFQNLMALGLWDEFWRILSSEQV